MYLSEVTLKNFRSYEDARFSFDKSLTLITGKNGAGKTNLLEAVYVLLQGTSFRVGDKDMVRDSAIWWRVDGLIEGEPRQVRYQLDHHPPKQIIEHESMKRFMHTDRLPIVLFEPSDLQLIHGSPSRRRDTLDLMLNALSHRYRTTLNKYERIIQQRNTALKKHSSNLEDQLFVWDIQLGEYGTTIIQARQKLVDDLNELIGGFYGAIAGNIHDVTISYQTELGRNPTTSSYVAHLHGKLQLDRLRGSTSFGPHRDDIVFTLRGSDAKTSASRGEIRTLLLALKMAYGKLLEMTHENKPLILLDDVFSELDETRQQNLLGIATDHQVIITHTKPISTMSQIVID
ncbi:MAG TPA: DNA replication and repair protein RecF [Candidatus Saccharibacteria bacterium]|nr:DNA replication and repair protein RecF [Candidatus Saccharibacteria bacterium]